MTDIVDKQEFRTLVLYILNNFVDNKYCDIKYLSELH